MTCEIKAPVLQKKDLHSLEQIWQSGNKRSQDEEVVEAKGPIEADLLANHLHGDGKRRPEVRVHCNVQEPRSNATPYSHMVDLGMEEIWYGNGVWELNINVYPCPILGFKSQLNVDSHHYTLELGTHQHFKYHSHCVQIIPTVYTVLPTYQRPTTFPLSKGISVRV